MKSKWVNFLSLFLFPDFQVLREQRMAERGGKQSKARKIKCRI
jgi:hypothetical protein